MSACKVTFEGFRRLVLKELTNIKTYKHFHKTVQAYEVLNGLDRFAEDMMPVLKACYDLDKTIQFTAERLDRLGKITEHAANLYVVELKHDRRS